MPDVDATRTVKTSSPAQSTQQTGRIRWRELFITLAALAGVFGALFAGAVVIALREQAKLDKDERDRLFMERVRHHNEELAKTPLFKNWQESHGGSQGEPLLTDHERNEVSRELDQMRSERQWSAGEQELFLKVCARTPQSPSGKACDCMLQVLMSKFEDLDSWNDARKSGGMTSQVNQMVGLCHATYDHG